MCRLANGKQIETKKNIVLFSPDLVFFFCSEPDILVEKKVKENKKGKDDSKENFDFSDVEKNSQDGFLMTALGTTSDTATCFESDSCNVGVGNSGMGNSMPVVKDAVANVQAVALDKLEIGSPDGTTTAEKDNEISTCIVCEKKFKSKSCMNKHLRSVHSGLCIYTFTAITKEFRNIINTKNIFPFSSDSENNDWC